MQAAHFENPMRRHHRIHPNRTWRVTGAVLLGHVGVACLLSSGMLTRVVPASGPDKVIMASVVMDAPTPPTPHTPPAPQRQPQAKPVSPQAQATPVLSPKAPSNTAPIASIVPSVPSAAPVPAMPATPQANSQRLAATATATATAAAVVLPSTQADDLKNPAPPYPRQSKRMGEEGTVLIRVWVTPEGRAEKTEIKTSSGHARLDEAALSTVQRWRFVPGQRNGLPEAMWFNVPIRFVLD